MEYAGSGQKSSVLNTFVLKISEGAHFIDSNPTVIMKTKGSRRYQLCASRSKLCKWLLIAALLTIILLAVAIPVGILVAQRKSLPKGIRATILVPLYIYPVAGAWDSLFNA